MRGAERQLFERSERDASAEWLLEHDARTVQNVAPCITILLCTLDGARFLPAQLASIEQQSHKNWRLIVSDDGSTDATLTMLHHFAKRVPHPVEIRAGPRRGPSANFLSLATDPNIVGDYFAFCDQDDRWHPDKLKHALGWLQSQPQDVSSVYCGRTLIVRESGDPYGHSPLFSKPPSFSNALVQSIAGGNTMVFGRATKQLLEKTGPVHIVAHDWWIYQLVSGSGGRVHYETNSHVDYRQHAANYMGSNKGFRAVWERVRMVLRGGFAAWNDLNLAALNQSSHLLTSDCQELLETYHKMRSGSLSVRLVALFRSGVRRQTLVGNVALLTAVVLKKI